MDAQEIEYNFGKSRARFNQFWDPVRLINHCTVIGFFWP